MNKFMTQVQHFVGDNAPQILTGLGLASILTGTVLAVKATPQAWIDIKNAQSEQTDPLTAVEKVKLTWRGYLPAAASVTVGVVSIFGANTLHVRKQASLLSLYSLSESSLREYRSKVKERIGEKAEREVREEIVEEKLLSNNQAVVYTGNGEHLCYDVYSDRVFKSDINAIRKAENDINRQCINHMYASLNDFYRAIGLAPTGAGDDLGWRVEDPLEIHFSSHLTAENQPCLAIEFNEAPSRGYYRAH